MVQKTKDSKLNLNYANLPVKNCGIYNYNGLKAICLNLAEFKPIDHRNLVISEEEKFD